MRLIQKVLEEGKQAIVLIPEIALTYQTVRRFYAMFGDKVSVLNSRLSLGERYDQFKRAKRGEVQVMVGPRSALFTPFSNLGLIVIDEEHEPTYKSENTPRYHARETAIQRAQMEHAQVVMGSATPSLEAYSHGCSGEYLLVIRQVEVGGCHKVRDMAEGTRIDQHRAEQGLLCDEAEGNLTLQGNLPAVPAPGEGLLSVHDRQPAQLQTSTWILPATSVYSLTSRSYCP